MIAAVATTVALVVTRGDRDRGPRATDRGPRGEGRGDRGPRREREGGENEGNPPEFAPAFLTGGNDED